MSRERSQQTPPPPANPRAGAVFGIVTGAVAMALLWVLSASAPQLLALATAGLVAALGGAAATSRLRRGATGANLAGLCSLAGAALVAIPILFSETGSGLTDFQVVLFGLALAALSSMGGQLAGSR